MYTFLYVYKYLSSKSIFYEVIVQRVTNAYKKLSNGFKYSFMHKLTCQLIGRIDHIKIFINANLLISSTAPPQLPKEVVLQEKPKLLSLP